MADIAARDDLAPGGAARPAKREARAMRTAREPGNQPPRTDVGTLVLHWATAIAFIVSLFTGIRIAADRLRTRRSRNGSPRSCRKARSGPGISSAGLTLFFCASAYLVYIMRARPRDPQRAEEDARAW